MKVIAGEKVYTVQEVAEILGLTPQSVRAYIRKGRLKAGKLGAAYIIAEENIKDFIRGVANGER
jgi:excisionase family DNA binding protein